MKSYVVGYMFDPGEDRVALIQKQRPNWQKGLFNGPGGKIEPGESPLDAMIREFREETGVEVDKWDHTITLVGDGFEVYCFRTYGDVDSLKSITDERIITYPVKYLPPNLVNNCRWMIPLSMEHDVVFPIVIKGHTLPGEGTTKAS